MSDAIEFRPDRRTAAVWAALGALLVAAGAWLVVDSGGAPLAWASLPVLCVVAGFFLLQLVAPSMFTVRFDDTELQARTLWYRVRVPWSLVQVVRVTRVAGDPALLVHVREPAETGDPYRTREVGVLLPLGIDLDRVHDFLRTTFDITSKKETRR